VTFVNVPHLEASYVRAGQNLWVILTQLKASQLQPSMKSQESGG